MGNSGGHLGGTRSAKFYSSGNRGVKKWPGERGPWCSPWHPCLDETKLKKLFYPIFFYKSSIHPNIILIYFDRVWTKIRIKGHDLIDSSNLSDLMRLLPPKEEILFGPKNSNQSYFKNGIQHTPTQSFLQIKPSNKQSNGVSC